MWGYRELIENLVVLRLESTLQALGAGLCVVAAEPLLLMLVFNVVSTLMLPNTTTPSFRCRAGRAAAWNFFNTAVMSALNSIVQSGHLIKKVYFPREILPISTVFSNFVNFLLALPVLFLLMAVFGVPFTANLLYLPLIMLVQIAFTIGIALILATLNVFYRDTASSWKSSCRPGSFSRQSFTGGVVPEWGQCGAWRCPCAA